MAEYEVVREVLNGCANSQLRDVTFYEIETDDPEAWVRGLLGPVRELTREDGADGGLTLRVRSGGLEQRFLFTRL